MADALVQAVVRIPNTTGISSDTVENVWNFHVDSATYTTNLAAVLQAVRDFYTVDLGAGMTRAVGAYYGPDMSRTANACQVLAYYTPDLTGATPFGSPVGQLTWTLPAASSTSPLPDEVALCLSIHGDLTGVPISSGGTRPQSRRRGRLYLGPFNGTATASESGRPRPLAALVTDALEAAENLMNVVGAIADWSWCVWSKADADVYDVEGGYIDNAWDTQRRRGVRPTTRSIFP